MQEACDFQELLFGANESVSMEQLVLALSLDRAGSLQLLIQRKMAQLQTMFELFDQDNSAPPHLLLL